MEESWCTAWDTSRVAGRPAREPPFAAAIGHVARRGEDLRPRSPCAVTAAAVVTGHREVLIRQSASRRQRRAVCGGHPRRRGGDGAAPGSPPTSAGERPSGRSAQVVGDLSQRVAVGPTGTSRSTAGRGREGTRPGTGGASRWLRRVQLDGARGAWGLAYGTASRAGAGRPIAAQTRGRASASAEPASATGSPRRRSRLRRTGTTSTRPRRTRRRSFGSASERAPR